MTIIADVLTDPVKQFTDKAGKPYANGWLYSYLGGTVTPHPTYADSGLTQANENPLRLDAAGRATIYMDQVVYQFRLANDLNQTVWIRDNVPGSVWPGAIDATSVRNPAPNENSYGHRFQAQINRAPSGTHTLLAGTMFLGTVISGSGAAVTNSATVFIDGAPNGATQNFALLIKSGDVWIDGQIWVGGDRAPLGGGAVATLGKTGAPGPTNAAQAGWQMLVDNVGVQFFVPYWR